MNCSYNATIHIAHRCTTHRINNMIIKKIKLVEINVFGVPELLSHEMKQN